MLAIYRAVELSDNFPEITSVQWSEKLMVLRKLREKCEILKIDHMINKRAIFRLECKINNKSDSAFIFTSSEARLSQQQE